MAELSKELVDALEQSVKVPTFFSMLPSQKPLPVIIVTMPSEFPDESVTTERARNYRVQIDYWSREPPAVERILSGIADAVHKLDESAFQVLSDRGFEPETKMYRLTVHYMINRGV